MPNEEELHGDDVESTDAPAAKGDVDVDDEEKPRTDIPKDAVKDDVIEYFGADGKDEGPKLMQNADGTWGEAQNAAG